MRWATLIMTLLLLLPSVSLAQIGPHGEWVPPRSHGEAQDRARRDLALLEELGGGGPLAGWYDLQRLRIVYFLGLEEEVYVDRLDRETVRFRTLHPDRGETVEATLQAYEAAAEVLRAKHAFWPGSKTGYLRTGLAALDGLVDAHPVHPEVRYLRLVSTAYLPFFFGRGEGAREDARVLAQLLPAARTSFPGPTLVAMTDVLLESNRLEGVSREQVQDLRGETLAITPADPLQALSPLGTGGDVTRGPSGARLEDPDPGR
jgi:hypothetical protein